jgi:transcriptional regulator with XRE-family HTH domain
MVYEPRNEKPWHNARDTTMETIGWLIALGAAIAQRRKRTINPHTRRRYSQREIARKAEIGEGTITQVEQGIATNARMYDKVARVLDLAIRVVATEAGGEVTLSIASEDAGSQVDAGVQMLRDPFVLEVAVSVRGIPVEHRARFLSILYTFRLNPEDVVVRRDLHHPSAKPRAQ